MDRAQKLLDQLVYLEERKDPADEDAVAGGDGILASPRQTALPSTSSALDPIGRKRRASALLPSARGQSAEDQSAVVCRPWSREDLLRRLRTYSTRTWFCKLDIVSATACASKGWINSGFDTLECELCKAKVFYPLCPSPSPKDVAGVAEKFHPLLDSVHDKFCPWKGRSCSLSLLQFPHATPAKLLADFTKRMDNLCCVRHLPKISEEILDDEDDAVKAKINQIMSGACATICTNQVLSRMLYNTERVDQGASQGEGGKIDWGSYEASLLMLAMCGWDAPVGGAGGGDGAMSAPSFGSDPAILRCDMCGARAGLWSFGADERAERPMHLDYFSWKRQQQRFPPSGGAARVGSHGHQGQPTVPLSPPPAPSLRGTARAQGFTCLTSPNYTATPQVVNLHMTIAGGATAISTSFLDSPDFSKGGEKISDRVPPKHKKKKRVMILGSRLKGGCCHGDQTAGVAHRRFCPWKTGWMKTLDALVPNPSSLDPRAARHMREQDEEAGGGQGKRRREDLVTMLTKVQRVTKVTTYRKRMTP